MPHSNSLVLLFAKEAIMTVTSGSQVGGIWYFQISIESQTQHNATAWLHQGKCCCSDFFSLLLLLLMLFMSVLMFAALRLSTCCCENGNMSVHVDTLGV